MCSVRVECIYVGSGEHFLCTNVWRDIKLTCLTCICDLFVFIVCSAPTLHSCDWSWFSCCVKKREKREKCIGFRFQPKCVRMYIKKNVLLWYITESSTGEPNSNKQWSMIVICERFLLLKVNKKAVCTKLCVFKKNVWNVLSKLKNLEGKLLIDSNPIQMLCTCEEHSLPLQ